MNKIHRRLWSTARQCWVVTSELAVTHGKSAHALHGTALIVAFGALVASVPNAHAQPIFWGCGEGQTGIVRCAPFVGHDNVSNADATLRSNYYFAMGAGAIVDGSFVTVFGNKARGLGDKTAVFGYAAQAHKGYSTVFGALAEADGVGAMAMGHHALAMGDNAMAFGSGAQTVIGPGSGRIAIGANSLAGSYGFSGAVALGEDTRAEYNSIAIGYRANASAASAMALGLGASATGPAALALGSGATASGRQALAVGESARSEGWSSFAIGAGAHAVAESGIALGYEADVTNSGARFAVAIGERAVASHQNTVALGATSVTTAANTVSVGNASLKRRIQYVADGVVSAGSTDAITGNQLHSTNQNVATAISTANIARTTALAAKTTADNALAKVNARDDLISQTAPDGNLRLGSGNTGTTLDISNRSGHTRSLTGLADGKISATSTEAVTGGQLQATHDRLATAQSRADAAYAGATAAQNTASQAKVKADATGNAVATAAAINDASRAEATGNLAMAMGQAAKANGVAALAVGHSAVATGNNTVAVGSASSATARAAIALGGNAKAKHENSVALGERSETSAANEVSVGNASVNLKRRIANVEDARLTASSSDAATGKQLFATNEKVQTNEAVLAGHGTDLAAQSGRIADNRRDLDALRSEFEDFDPDLDGVVKFAADGSVNIAGGKLLGVAAGDISSAVSTDAVNGGQLFATNQRLSQVEDSSSYLAVGRGGDQLPAVAGSVAVALGDSAEASPRQEGAVAVGAYADARAKNSVAVGRSAGVDESSENAVAMGFNSSVGEARGVAIGASSRVEGGAQQSVAIGSNSIASESLTVSFGHDGMLRRLVRVDRGTSNNDVATVVQLRESVSALGGGSLIDGNGQVVAPSYNIQGGTRNNVGDALAALDSAVVTADRRVDSLEGKLSSAFQHIPSVRADGLNQLTFAGANGMVLSNVANGAIAAGSRDAVNGGQLHSMQQQLNGRIDGLEQRIDGQPQAPQTRALTVAAADGNPASSAAVATPAADESAAPPTSSGDNKPVVAAGNAPKSSPQPQADAPKPEAPTPQVDTAELEKMLARANDYTDGISREVDARLDKMDKRFNRMAAMNSAQAAMAMNTAGLATYNRLGAGVGYSDGESAMAVGYQRVLNDKGSATFSLNGAFTNSGERSMGVGVGIGW